MIEMRWLKRRPIPDGEAESVLQYRFKQYKVVKGESLVNGVEVTMSDWITVPMTEEA